MKKVFCLIFMVILIGMSMIAASCSSSEQELVATIVFHADNAETYEMVSVKLSDVAALTLPTPTKKGYTFEGWFFDKDLSNPYKVEIVKDGVVELFAKWSINKYSITIHNETNEETLLFDYNEPIQLSEPIKEGYSFFGFFTDSEMMVNFNLINMPDSDIDLYPKFVETSSGFTIEYKFDSQKGYLLGDRVQIVEANKMTDEVEIVALNGYSFIGCNDNLVSAKRSDKAIDNAVFEAQFEKVYKLTVLNGTPDYGTIAGETIQELREGETSSTVTAVPNLGYKFKSWSNDTTEESICVTLTEDTVLYAIFAIEYLELPVMEIYTEDRAPIVSKEEYTKCKISVSNAEFDYNFDFVDGKIRGRGNSTWWFPKTPYKLKFDKKTDLFGNGAAKTWTLIANYCDPSMIRNSLAYSLGNLVEADYTTSTQFVDLYLNGEYEGVYLVCEQNEVGETRVDIDESYDNVDTGYLLEWVSLNTDVGLSLGKDYFIIDDMEIEIKSPDTSDERFSKENVEFIKAYVLNAYNAIIEKDLDLVEQYIDLDSFARAYLVHEIFNRRDFVGSTFLYKDKDGLLKTGPLWDFDLSAGNDFDDTMHFMRLSASFYNKWYRNLCQLNSFNNRVAALFGSLYLEIINEINVYCDNIYSFSNSFNRNYDRWPTLGHYVWPNPEEIVAISTWEGQVEYLREWLLKSVDYLYNYYVNCASNSYGIQFNVDENSNILAYNTNDYNSGAIILYKAWSRDLNSGELLKDGNGQIAFKVNCLEGFVVDEVFVSDPLLIDEILLIDEANGIYLINGIKGNIVVTIKTKEAALPTTTEFIATFEHDEHVSIIVYDGKDYSVEGTLTDNYAIKDISGDGQVNFKVVLEEGYAIDTINVTGSYKNLKGAADTGVENVYRITKACSDLTINVSVKRK